MSFTSELITAENAAPMTTATARSIMLPLNANALNSCSSCFRFMTVTLSVVPANSNLLLRNRRVPKGKGQLFSDSSDRQIESV